MVFGTTMSARDERQADADHLIAAAQQAWVGEARGQRWTVWARLSWSWTAAATTASRQVEAWATRLQARVPGASVMVGLHTDTERIHAHALVFIPKRWYRRRLPRGVRRVDWAWDAWLRWEHGLTWAEPYSPPRTAQNHGAAAYLAREVGTVWQYGKAPPYRPRRRRETAR
jgi:hypothetical protein